MFPVLGSFLLDLVRWLQDASKIQEGVMNHPVGSAVF